MGMGPSQRIRNHVDRMVLFCCVFLSGEARIGGRTISPRAILRGSPNITQRAYLLTEQDLLKYQATKG